MLLLLLLSKVLRGRGGGAGGVFNRCSLRGSMAGGRSKSDKIFFHHIKIQFVVKETHLQNPHRRILAYYGFCPTVPSLSSPSLPELR